MYATLSLEDCLYVIKQNDLDEFKKLIDNHPVFIESSQNKLEFWQIALNIYYTLNNTTNKYVTDPSKFILYSSNFYCLHSIVEIDCVQKFVKYPPTSPSATFILAHYLTVRLYQLIKQYLEQDPCGHVALDNLKTNTYYRQHLKNCIQDDISHQFHRIQKVLVKVITHAKDDGTFEKQIQESVIDTRQYLRVHAR